MTKKIKFPVGTNLHAMIAWCYIQECAKESVQECMKDIDLAWFVLGMTENYPKEWEFFQEVAGVKKA